MNNSIDLQNIKTKDLLNELSNRKGVEKRIAEPYEEININVMGPAVILVIVD